MEKAKKLNIGFIVHDGMWLGGLIYMQNLMTAIRLLPQEPLVPIIFTGMRSRIHLQFPKIHVVRTALLDRQIPTWFMRKPIRGTSIRDRRLQNLLMEHDVGVLSHSGHLGKNSSIPTAGWIPDFQHLHRPEFFTERDRRERDRGYMDLCAKCNKVIVSSECARMDLRDFAPQYGSKAAVLHFVASPSAYESAPSLSELQQRYQFEEPYFLLPNQFWAHKNHRVVITALKLLKQRGQRVQVMATGATHDHRRPGFFDALMAYAKECDVLDRFRVLGVIPFSDLSGLMFHAMALINPSYFEGWSTSVEEAKSLGKRILLSDIPVHREQSPTRGIYFTPDDAETLAQNLWSIFRTFDPQSDYGMQENTRLTLPRRQIRFAETFHRIMLSAQSDSD